MLKVDTGISLMTLKRLYEFIEHGDEKHRDWLWRALVAFRNGGPRPDES